MRNRRRKKNRPHGSTDWLAGYMCARKWVVYNWICQYVANQSERRASYNRNSQQSPNGRKVNKNIFFWSKEKNIVAWMNEDNDMVNGGLCVATVPFQRHEANLLIGFVGDCVSFHSPTDTFYVFFCILKLKTSAVFLSLENQSKTMFSADLLPLHSSKSE